MVRYAVPASHLQRVEQGSSLLLARAGKPSEHVTLKWVLKVEEDFRCAEGNMGEFLGRVPSTCKHVEVGKGLGNEVLQIVLGRQGDRLKVQVCKGC